MKRKLTVDPGAADERLDVFLASRLGLSRSRVQTIVRAGHVLVGGRPQRVSYLVQPGDSLAVTLPEGEPARPTPTPPNLPIVYEDAELLVIDKPARLAAHPGSGTAGVATVADFARPRTTDRDPDRPGIVHRLDRDTSGLMIIAKTPAAKTHLQQQFRTHAVRKTYILLATGRVNPSEAVIRLPTGRDPARPLRRAVVAGGRETVTRYRTLANYPGYTLVEATPETGRTHQLRVHFAAIGHPIAGDSTYGQPQRTLPLQRQFLHATAIEFDAPSGQHISLKSPLPADLQKVVQTLEDQV